MEPAVAPRDAIRRRVASYAMSRRTTPTSAVSSGEGANGLITGLRQVTPDSMPLVMLDNIHDNVTIMWRRLAEVRSVPRPRPQIQYRMPRKDPRPLFYEHIAMSIGCLFRRSLAGWLGLAIAVGSLHAEGRISEQIEVKETNRRGRPPSRWCRRTELWHSPTSCAASPVPRTLMTRSYPVWNVA